MEIENRCGEIKATLQKLTDVKCSPTARLVAVLATCGISDTAEVASLIGRSVRMVQVARNELREAHCAEAKPIAPGETHCAKPIAESETHCAPRVHACAQMESPSGIDILERVEDPPVVPQFSVDSETCEQFHEICLIWGRKPDAIEFNQPTIEDTNRQLAGEIKAVAVLHPEAEPRVLHAALLTALNTASAKAREPQDGQFKGRGQSSASSYLRKTYTSEVARMMREAANAEAHRRADHHVHKTTLDRRITGAPNRSSRPNLATMEFPA
jgi:hypothetical protein